MDQQCYLLAICFWFILTLLELCYVYEHKCSDFYVCFFYVYTNIFTSSVFCVICFGSLMGEQISVEQSFL